MTIEIRHGRTSVPQATHEQPGLRFTEANFSIRSMDCGLCDILGDYPAEGFSELDTDMVALIVSGYVSLEEEGGEIYQLEPLDRACIPKGTRYRWRKISNEIPLLYMHNSPPFDPLKR